MLFPLADQYDLGFGAVADSFKEAADALLEYPNGTPSFTEHLPIAYLLRHAIELYLKSGIVVLHRYFSIDYGPHPLDGEPWVPVDGIWVRMRNVHSPGDLYLRLKSLFDDNLDQLLKRTNTRWELPASIGEAISFVDGIDSSSTFFRYPFTKHDDDHSAKEVVQQVEVDDIWAGLTPGGHISRIIVGNAETGASRVYERNDEAAQQALERIASAAQFMHDFHAATRGELTRGA